MPEDTSMVVCPAWVVSKGLVGTVSFANIVGVGVMVASGPVAGPVIPAVISTGSVVDTAGSVTAGTKAVSMVGETVGTTGISVTNAWVLNEAESKLVSGGEANN